MDIEKEIAEYLENHLSELIDVDELNIHSIKSLQSKEDAWKPDFIASVSFKKLRLKLIGEIIGQSSSATFKEKLSLLKSYAAKDKDERLVPLVVARYLSPARRDQCQKEGICFLDLSGNVFLRYDSLYIERTGFTNRFPEKRIGRNPFSDKASLILRAAFSDVKKVWGVRELAQSVGLDPGFVSRMAKELKKRNYLSRADSKLKLRDPVSLLEDWVREYNFNKNQEIPYFCLTKGPEEIIEKMIAGPILDNVPYALGLHAGANLVAPYSVFNQVHVYIQNKADIDRFVKNLKLRKANEGANLVFLLPYYKHSVFYGKQRINNLYVASDLQLYLDLHNYPIRGLEQAEHLYEKRLKHIIED